MPEERPEYLGADLRVLLEAYPDVVVDAGIGHLPGVVGAAVDAAARSTVTVDGDPWDAVRAAAALAWAAADAGPAARRRRSAGRAGSGTGLTALPGDAAGSSGTGTVDPAAGTAPPHGQTKE